MYCTTPHTATTLDAALKAARIMMPGPHQRDGPDPTPGRFRRRTPALAPEFLRRCRVAEDASSPERRSPHPFERKVPAGPSQPAKHTDPTQRYLTGTVRYFNVGCASGATARVSRRGGPGAPGTGLGPRG